MTKDDLQNAVNALARHESEQPQLSQVEPGYMKLDGVFNAAQLRLIAGFLGAENSARHNHLSKPIGERP